MKRTKVLGLRRNVAVATANAALKGRATPRGAGLQPCDPPALLSE